MDRSVLSFSGTSSTNLPNLRKFGGRLGWPERDLNQRSPFAVLTTAGTFTCWATQGMASNLKKILEKFRLKNVEGVKILRF